MTSEKRLLPSPFGGEGLRRILPPSPLGGEGLGVRGLGLLVTVVLLAASGCGNQATVTGTVTYKGRPVTYGTVIVVSASNVARTGVIYPDGTYTVVGLPPGAAKIGVVSHDPTKGRSILHHNKPVRRTKKGKPPVKPAPPKEWFPLPRSLEDPATSGLVCSVQPGATLHDLELR